jgi:rhodanese-related sulfurtransferase
MEEKNKGIIIDGILNVTAHEAAEYCKNGAIILDVRESYQNRHKIFDVEEIISCPASIVEDNYNDFPQDTLLIIADASGIHSKEVVSFLKEKGFDKIANLAGGIVDWERAGLKVVTDNSERLSGSCMCMLKKREQ